VATTRDTMEEGYGSVDEDTEGLCLDLKGLPREPAGPGSQDICQWIINGAGLAKALTLRPDGDCYPGEIER
jgi:hypothetical protein